MHLVFYRSPLCEADVASTIHSHFLVAPILFTDPIDYLVGVGGLILIRDYGIRAQALATSVRNYPHIPMVSSHFGSFQVTFSCVDGMKQYGWTWFRSFGISNYDCMDFRSITG